MTVLGYIATVWILTTYAVLVRCSNPRPFHWANAVGCVPLIVGEIAVGAGPPLVLTTAFGVVGWVGVLRGQR